MIGDGARVPSLREIAAGAAFAARLPGFLRRPYTVAEARAILQRRLERRETDFVALAREAIYATPGSPYRQLLEVAGCEYGDLARLVTQEGVEGALRVLYRQGVYLTVEEFKGRRPAVRGGVTIEVDPGRCRNPCLSADVATQSSGSRGPRSTTAVSIEFVRDGAVNKCLSLDARGGPWRVALWDVPGGGVTAMLGYSKGGPAVERWFSPVDPADPRLHPRYRWSARALRWGSLLAGRPLPAPCHVSVDDPLSIARWIVDVRREAGRPFLVAYTSPVVRLCRAARDAGLDLGGARFSLWGEPLTDARLAVIRRTGADAFSVYATSETGIIGDGCLAPRSADDMHLLSDSHALIQPGPGGARPGLPPPALLISSLRPTAPLILLNVSMGDQAVVSARGCGCALEHLGWTTHLHAVRSYEKLTAAGMTFLDADVVRVLEEVLPARFGGAPTDYQLVEEEDADGSPRVALLVHPVVGPAPPEEVARAFLAAISPGSGVERVMGTVWRDAGFPRVERRPPLATPSGKVLHLHVASPRRLGERAPADSPR
jgi:hypothetical protein